MAVADAASPQGPYTDRGPLVCQDAGSIDAAPVTDENGRRYLLWKEDGNSQKRPTPLWAQPLSPDGIKLVGEKQEILRNEAPREAHLVEGPFVLRRADYFYMFYSADACCGRRCSYKLGVARSRKLLGPWERYDRNPILAGNEQWKCPGHGSTVDDPAGRTFLLYHAYHPSDFEFVGRQGLLDEVTWGEEGWPSINQGRGPSHGPRGRFPRRRVESRPRSGRVHRPVRSTRHGSGPGISRWRRASSLSAAVGYGFAPVPRSHAIAARPTLTGSYVATAVVDSASMTAGARAGVAAFGNRDNLLADLRRTLKRIPRVAAAECAARRRLAHSEGAAVDAGDRYGRKPRYGAPAARGDRPDALPVRRQRRRSNLEDTGAATRGRLPAAWDLAVRAALLVAGPDASATFGAYRLESVTR